MTAPVVRILPCPTCRKPTRLSADNRSRPFCSERCRLIDLGEWASGGRAIPGEPDIDTPSSDDPGRDG